MNHRVLRGKKSHKNFWFNTYRKQVIQYRLVIQSSNSKF